MSFSPPGASQVKRDGRFWKAINDFLSVFNWHFCSIAHRLWGISCLSWFLYKAEVRKCRFLRYGASQVNYDGRFWKAFNDFLLVFNWHFCYFKHRLWVISCCHPFVCKPAVTWCRFLRYGSSQVNYDGKFWKVFNDFLLVFNWHFCSITHRLWVISCFHWFLCKPEVTCNVDFSTRDRHRSITTADSEAHSATSY